tara:strand:- start:1981 stop:2265 length:285 start_codon:yes stop_codon:yes gene_type:complete
VKKRKDLSFRRNFTVNLQRNFGTCFIPYEEVAKSIFGFEKHTALSRINSITSLGLKTVSFSSSRDAPIFVFVTDLADFLLCLGSKRLTKNIADN